MNSPLRIYPAGAYPLLVLALFIILVILLIPLLVLGIAGAAFSRLGFSWIGAVAVILLMLAGSFVNIPLYTFRVPKGPGGSGRTEVLDAFTGEPVPDETSLATVFLNLGGALIPAAACVFLLYRAGSAGTGPLAAPLALCLLIVAVITYLFTSYLPVQGLRAPLFLPALTALACGFFLCGGTGLAAGVTAFTGGTMGVLAGATARGIARETGAGLREISIGGAGMFGSVFLCAVLAALVA